jgi:hypothetical protein
LKSTSQKALFRHAQTIGRTAIASAMVVLFSSPAEPKDFRRGDFSLSWHNTLTYGLSFRLVDRDPRLIGLSSGGTAFSVNADDGNLNYDSSLFSNTPQINSELQVEYHNFGGFARVRGFYDIENEHGERARTPLSPDALHRVGSRIELLDGFVWGKFGLTRMPTEVRVGNQVLSWGESTFFQNGINVINPVDVSALRVPGAELRNALLPESMVWASTSPSDAITVEAFYLVDWTETKIDPPGAYFSTTDAAGEGADKVMLGFGSVPDSIPVGAGVGAPVGVAVPRGDDREAGNQGQYGAALRLFPSVLNDIELGFFFINYHSRLPIINGRTGTLQGLRAGDYAASARYFISYPEDIQLFGASFNTEIGTTGIALQGEASHRWDAPLQIDDVELVFASLSPLALVESPTSPGLGTLLARTNQIGAFGFDETVPGFIERSVTQLQATASKVFGPSLGADQAILLGEAAVTRVHDMPDKDTLRLDAPGTFTSGNPVHTLAGVQPATEATDFFADPTSWGYSVVGRLEYNGAIRAINLLPRFTWQHDVKGNSPGPAGNFIEGRKAFTVGLTGVYQNNWSVDVSYSSFFGAGRHNLLNDRDFLALSVTYAF